MESILTNSRKSYILKHGVSISDKVLRMNKMEYLIKDRIKATMNDDFKFDVSIYPFLSISHITTVNNLKKILRSGLLEHRLSLGKKNLPAKSTISGNFPDEMVHTTMKDFGQFPGVYTHLNTDSDFWGWDNIEYDPEGVVLIFSLDYLKQKNWHFNLVDQFGAINSYTYTRETLPKDMIWYHRTADNDENYVSNELVFHDALDIFFLDSVIIHNKYKYVVQKLLLNYPNVKIYIKQDPPKIKLFKNTDSDKLNKSDPQLCYPFYDHLPRVDYPGYKLTDKEIRCVRQKNIINCGNEVKETTIIQNLDDIYFGNKERYPVIEKPPFSDCKN
jgi:hypothetical protein